MNFYITSDEIGLPDTGGGSVTFNECRFLEDYVNDRRNFERFGRKELNRLVGSPSERDVFTDDDALFKLADEWDADDTAIAHFYAGTWSKTIDRLKTLDYTIVYTAAAHDVEISKREHEILGIPFDYPHLTDPNLLERYLRGYRKADVVVCPSNHSKKVMERFGCKNVVVIPHGIEPTDKKLYPIKPPPKTFTVGYLGSCTAPDKCLRMLLTTWKLLNYSDAVLKIGGRDSDSPFFHEMIRRYGGGRIELCGWVKDKTDFYDSLSVYVQPSATEGFGIEVSEALDRGIPVLCSEGAGACEIDEPPRIITLPSPDRRIDMLSTEIWQKIINYIRHRLKRYDSIFAPTWCEIGRRYHKLYETL